MRDGLDLAIIGSGPAGLSAAITASRCGLSVAVLDDQSAPGGQIYRAVEASASKNRHLRALLGKDYQAGAELVDAFRSSEANYHPDHKIWGLSSEGDVSLVGPDGAREFRAKRVLIAAGAMERPMPIPGWTLPGVMTAGSAQIQMKTAGQVPDVPFVIAGSGPLLYLVAWQLNQAKAPLKAVLDTTPVSNYVRATRHLYGALTNFSQIKKGLGWIYDLKRSGVQIISRVADLSIEGNESVENVRWTTSSGKTGAVACQIVLLHQGVVPNYQLASLAECDVVWDDCQKSWRTNADIWGATSQNCIAVAGDGGAISGAIAARDQGYLAGLDAAFRLNKIGESERDEQATAALNTLRRNSRFRRFVDELYKPPDWTLVPKDDTIVCRCEEIKACEIRRAAQLGAVGANQVKFYTRAGMGRCQGRMCGLACTAICAQVHAKSPSEVGFARVRPPIRPVTIGEMADCETRIELEE